MIRAVVIGLGRIGFSLENDPYREKPCTHVGAIIKNRSTQLVAGVDTDLEKRQVFTKKTGTLAFSSWEEVVTNVGIPHLVCIATPASAHGIYLQKAIKSQVPVVVMEKPIAENYREALKLKNYVDRNKNISRTRVVVNHERRFAEDYLYVSKLLKQQTLGELSSISGALYTNVPTNIATLLHDGTHLTDTVNFLSGSYSDNINKKKITDFKLLANNQSHGIKFYFRFNGTPTYLEIGGRKDYFHFEISLMFSKGKIEIGNNIFAEYRIKPSKLYRGFTSLVKSNRTFTKTKYFSNMLKHAVWLCKNPKAKSGSSINDAFLVYQIMEKIAE